MAAAMELEKVDCKSTADEGQVEKIFHMNGGEGDYSYAKNALTQKKLLLKTKPLAQESIVELYSNSFPECLKIADFGCASGPNAYLPTWDVIEALQATCHRLNRKPPTLQVFLNDLPGNDFNNTFKLLPSFYERLKREMGNDFGHCFIAAVPGSFYGRLFPSRSLHLVFSSNALHWLSQAPKGLVGESGNQLIKGSVCLIRTSPPSVHKAYLEQFESDFVIFLKSRSEELKPGGRMVLTFKCDDKRYPTTLWEPFSLVVNHMVSEGLIEKSKSESFKVPFYSPSVEEVRSIIQQEGSFNIHHLETHHQSWFVNFDGKGLELDKYTSAKQTANGLRAVGESLVATHFGNAIVDEIFQRYYLKLIEYLEKGTGVSAFLLVSLIKKT